MLTRGLAQFPIIWEETRGFSLGQGGLIFIGVGIGTTLGAALNIWLQKHYRYLVPKWHGHPPCEERLYGAIIAGPCLIIGIFWLGWTGNYPSVPWYVPALATIPLGMSFTLVRSPSSHSVRTVLTAPCRSSSRSFPISSTSTW